MIKFDGLRQDYGSRCVLDISSLTLRCDGRYALFGANGAGKSTLLRVLLTQLSSGSDPARLGYLPQKPYAFSFSVRKNIELGIPLTAGLTSQQKRDLVDRQLTEFGLQHLAQQRADKMSGGETQRMALARLLVYPREVLLLDEPANSMDLSSIQLASRAVELYLQANRCLFILASHQLSLISQLTEEMLFLDQGQLVEKGTTLKLLKQPKSEKLKQLLQLQQLSELT